ncbi:MAG: RluA family pseudouridine synthase [Eubacteriales bacterium]|nr:RluA family pseudouridine synthase [Eubacteriales bacterium]
MQKWIITANEQNQRLDKYLRRRLPAAGSSFLYKMMRKKNITLNGKKAGGSELIEEGDEITLFLSDETIAKFAGSIAGRTSEAGARAGASELSAAGAAGLAASAHTGRSVSGTKRMTQAGNHASGTAGESGDLLRRITPASILYEDEHLLFVVKPAGVLSQKAHPEDISMNEWLLDYLRGTGYLTPERLSMYRPSVCNRLDRNTGGILLCAKTLPASQMLSALLRSRELEKYYRMVVRGTITDPGEIRGMMEKDSRSNTVRFTTSPDCSAANTHNSVVNLPKRGDGTLKQGVDGVCSETRYRPLRTQNSLTLVEALLVTGKTHQLRAHFASIGHPIAGDPKYGDPALNRRMRSQYGVRHQLLFACRLQFPPQLPEPFGYLAGRVFEAAEPEVFRRVMR